MSIEFDLLVMVGTLTAQSRASLEADLGVAGKAGLATPLETVEKALGHQVLVLGGVVKGLKEGRVDVSE
jgi:hypothetical protein